MKIFDPHIHMTSRSTDDYEAMARAGILAIVEPAFWLGQPRTHAGSFVDYFNSLLGWERFRASQFGIRHFCTIGLNPKEANNRKLSDEVLALMPRFLAKDGVVAVGEIGFDDQTDEEEHCLVQQIKLAAEFSLPIVLESKCWAGHTIYPNTKMDELRMATLVKKYGTDRIIVNSAADWGISDPLKVPKTIDVMREQGIAEAAIQTIVWDNPVAFFSQSGKLNVDDLEQRPTIDRTQKFETNSVLRGDQR
jgi:predicted metal-dependent TIM-barrel fold hydrolase